MYTPRDMLDRFLLAMDCETDSQLSRKLDINRGTIGGWRKRDSIPINYYVEWAEKEDISLNWLLLGMGPQRLTEALAPPPAPATSTAAEGRGEGRGRTLADTLAAEGRRAEKELGLGEVATLAKLGSAGGAWRIMKALLEVYPGGKALEDLAALEGRDVGETSAHLALLRRAGSVEELPGGLYRLRPGRQISRSLTVPDEHQAALTAAGSIIHRVLPAMGRQQGRLEMVESRVRAGDGRELLNELSAAVARVAEAGAESPGDDERLTIIVAVAVDEEAE